ncbi:serine protease [Qipengyuania sp. DY56-A-20]|jgi:serine protease Do|uniref:Serine protease n=1 Tax=Qipengyuania benthica TaxID=3067651 RepID=A0ABT9HAI4_9SPHN|nr:serine protease [Qipengyuania sp. DY56-A-20]MDP4539845.1 serine protease [Qipengyuania sp. DY56-A-20]
MGRLLTLLVLLLGMFVAPSPAQAEPADIDAAARGVVRVVILGSDGEEVYPISHGSGFAVSPTQIVTNAHVIRDALADDSLRIGIVPSDGAGAVYGKAVAISSRNDLALVELTGDLRLPPLTLVGGPLADSGESYAVGYPMNVDKAQGLDIGDIFRSQPPVKSRGFLAGTRPSRSFDTVLHTAPIARGNSGGPLLDGCGRVLGVNSFGADSGGSDAEFFFAVSNRELRAFLRDNGVAPRINDTECRSLDDLEAEERARLDREQSAARAALDNRSEEERVRRERARFEAEMQVRDERDDRMLASVLLLLLGAGLIWWAFEKREPVESEFGTVAWPVRNRIVLALGIGAVLMALMLHVSRPGIDEIDRRVSAVMGGEADESDGAGELRANGSGSGKTDYVCTLDPQRSRVTSAQAQQVSFEWSAQGCVNGRTQYGLSAGTWSRVFVPNEEQAVAVNSFDPARRIYRTERYLLSRGAMNTARAARSKYSAPACGTEDAASSLGDMQTEVVSSLPTQPNERLVYSCEVAEGD